MNPIWQFLIHSGLKWFVVVVYCWFRFGRALRYNVKKIKKLSSPQKLPKTPPVSAPLPVQTPKTDKGALDGAGPSPWGDGDAFESKSKKR